LNGTISITDNNGTLTAAYTGNESGTTTYQWNKGGVPIPGATGSTYTPTGNGSYTVTVSKPGYNHKTSGPVTIGFDIGETGPGGGKIFYYSEEGFTVEMTDPAQNYTAHYLEAAPVDMAGMFVWSASTAVSGTAAGIGTGRRNTARILNVSPAAKACTNYSNNGKTDWFLPSKDELYRLYINRASVGNLTTKFYASSTHGGGNSNGAWGVNFINGDQALQIYCYSVFTVRPIRAF
jgi:hypothetical protein